ncbi:MAG: sulfatase [Bryobacterales bacterium]|nr:sulfatase [Bryobacterales bacterium]
MIRRDFLAGSVAAAAGSSMTQGSMAQGAMAQGSQPPNIVYIHSHDTGRYLQPYGHNIPTPNLQKLAEEGVLFRRAYNAAPTCSPSRAALLTGCCPHVNGMLGLAHRGFSLNDYKQHVIHTLKPAGYTSALFGVQHVARVPEMIGYDYVAKLKSSRAEHVAPAAAEFVRNAPKQPFFLTVGFFETHREFPQAGPKEDPRFCQPPAPIPDMLMSREDMARYKASARLLDDAVGQVLRALEEAGLAENTLVISTTDHGIAFPAMKCNLTDHGIGVSLIMRGPGGFRGGKVSDAMVSHLDLFPTICDMAGVQHPAWLEGHSMMPLIRGEKEAIRDQICAEVNYHAAYEPKRTVRTDRWAYIRRFGDHATKPVLPNCDDGLSKDIWLEYGWRERPQDEEQLYDLVFDPNETRNMAKAPEAREALAEMRKRMEQWMQSTNDPLLKGPVKAPAGAKVNDPNGTSPREAVQPAG